MTQKWRRLWSLEKLFSNNKLMKLDSFVMILVSLLRRGKLTLFFVCSVNNHLFLVMNWIWVGYASFMLAFKKQAFIAFKNVSWIQLFRWACVHSSSNSSCSRIWILARSLLRLEQKIVLWKLSHLVVLDDRLVHIDCSSAYVHIAELVFEMWHFSLEAIELAIR